MRLVAPGGHYADEAESVLTAMTPPSQCYHTVQALSHLRSGGIPLRITSLAELPEHCRCRVRFPIQHSGQRILNDPMRVGACRYPIRNSARDHSRPNTVPVSLLSNRKGLRRLSMAEAGIGSGAAG